MAQASYSFLDVAALDEVRERFAAGDALVILSGDLEEVIWANGPGAALFGHADVEAILGAEAPLGAAAKRQIAAISGFPAIGRDRALLVRVAIGVSSQALPLLASAVTLPDGEKAILLAQPAAAGGPAGARRLPERAIGGFAAAGHFLAFVDADGVVEAASAGFARLGLTPEDAGGNDARGERRQADRQAHAAGPAWPAARRTGAADRCQAPAGRDRRGYGEEDSGRRNAGGCDLEDEPVEKIDERRSAMPPSRCAKSGISAAIESL